MTQAFMSRCSVFIGPGEAGDYKVTGLEFGLINAVS